MVGGVRELPRWRRRNVDHGVADATAIAVNANDLSQPMAVLERRRIWRDLYCDFHPITSEVRSSDGYCPHCGRANDWLDCNRSVRIARSSSPSLEPVSADRRSAADLGCHSRSSV